MSAIFINWVKGMTSEMSYLYTYIQETTNTSLFIFQNE